MRITNEILSGDANNWTLARTPVPNSVTIYGGGIRLTPGIGQDYSIAGISVTTVNPYSAGQVLADYDVLDGTNIVSGISDQLSPFALTTLQRVKDLLFDPNLTISLTGASLSASSTNVTGLSVPAGKSIKVGQIIMGTGIPNGTTIAAIVSPTQITLSQASTQDNTGQTLIVIDQTTAYDAVLVRLINWATNYIGNECGRPSGFVQQSYVNDIYSIDSAGQNFLLLRNTPVFSLSSFQWRAGTPSNPSWTDFLADEYELVDPRTDPISGTVWYPSGEIRVYGALPRINSNMIRVSYVAGYPVDWSNPENHTTHWLPGDLTNVCENLVVRRYLRRTNGGKSSISVEGSTTSFRNELDAEDLDVIGQYRQVTF
ncbi:MAG TPA: hypothetical protein VHY35_06340 [Stellaceae bacterium]|jgi:hypothetical protein|nr:hypothetical protein [Stellaceae bacterium]